MALSSQTVVSRNPLHVTGTAMPANVLLMAKLLVIGLIVTNQVRLLPEPFLPFVPGLDHLLPAAIFHRTLQVVVLVSMSALIFNYAVRTSCLFLGSSILLGLISSRAYYSNNMTLCALLFILAGLSVRGMEPYILRLQIALVYFGAALNKALDPDWHSGQFFDHWAIDALHQPVYIALHSLFPPLVLGKLACWGTIVVELCVSIMLLVPKLQLYGVSMSIALQCGFLLFTGQTFGMFFFDMQAAALAFLHWPTNSIEVIYDGSCGFCDWCRRQFARLDFDKLFVWLPYQSGCGRAYGITDESASRRLQLVSSGGHVLQGFHAIRRILVFTPIIWMAIFALIGIGHGRRALVAGVLFFFSPLANRIGVAAYDLVARHRHRILPGRTCGLPHAMGSTTESSGDGRGTRGAASLDSA